MSVADTDGGRILDGANRMGRYRHTAGEIRCLHIVLTAPMLTVKVQTVSEAALYMHLTLSKPRTILVDHLLLYSNQFRRGNTATSRDIRTEPSGPTEFSPGQRRGIFARLLGCGCVGYDNCYSVVVENFWAAGYIAALTDYGFMKAIPTQLPPDRAIQGLSLPPWPPILRH
jgi:hypothetical protein